MLDPRPSKRTASQHSPALCAAPHVSEDGHDTTPPAPRSFAGARLAEQFFSRPEGGGGGEH